MPAGASSVSLANRRAGIFDGRFEKFTWKILFADEDLAGSKFEVEVDMKSVNTQDDERDTGLRDEDGFSVEKFPKSRFVTSSFTRKAPGQYEAVGKLTIRDVTREIRVPFSFTTTQEGGKPVASLKGGVKLNRLDYGVGQGQWKDTTVFADEVRVKFELRLLPDAPASKPADQPAQSQAKEK